MAQPRSGRLWLLLALALVGTIGVIVWALWPSDPVPEPDVAEWVAPDPVPTPERPRAEPEHVVTATPARTASVSGVIRSSAGQPLTATVRLEPASGEALDTTAGPGGAFAFADVPPGEWTLLALAPGHEPGRLAGIQVAVGQAIRRDLLLQAQGVVQGKVVDEQDRPVPRAVIQIVGDDSQVFRAGPDGSFVIASTRKSDGSGFGPLELIAVSPLHAPSSPERAVPGQAVTLRLMGGGYLTVKTVLPTGQPLANVLISLEPTAMEGPAATSAEPPAPIRTSQDGQATKMGPLRPGTYIVRGETLGFAPVVQSGIVIRAGAETGPIELMLQPGVTLRGVVTDAATGQPVRGAQLALLDPAARMPAKNAVSYTRGEYVLGNLPSGRATLRISATGYRPELLPLDVPAAGEMEQDVRLSVAKAGERMAFQGIGATLGKVAGGIVIQQLLPDSPAAQAGLQAGDKIVRVDDTTTDQLGLMQVTERIRGESGSPVVLEVERNGQRFRVQVTRGNVVLRD